MILKPPVCKAPDQAHVLFRSNLSILKSLVESIKGKLSITSDEYPFISTTFTLEIPVAVPVLNAAQVSVRKEKSAMTRLTMDGQLPSLPQSDILLFRQQPTEMQRYLYAPPGVFDSRTPT